MVSYPEIRFSYTVGDDSLYRCSVDLAELRHSDVLGGLISLRQFLNVVYCI